MRHLVLPPMVRVERNYVLYLFLTSAIQRPLIDTGRSINY